MTFGYGLEDSNAVFKHVVFFPFWNFIVFQFLKS